MPHHELLNGEFLTAAMLACLSSVAALVGLFFYLNHYTRRDYFTIWGVAWLFYGVWLVLRVSLLTDFLSGWSLMLSQWYIGTSAVFLLWGSLRFMGLPTPQRSFAFFLAFIYSWAYASDALLTNQLWVELPVFSLAALASASAAIAFYRDRRRRRFTGATLLMAGFALWGVYLASYPIAGTFPSVRSILAFLSSGLQLFIGVSMIVLMLEEARASSEQMSEEIRAVKSEKELLQGRMISAEAEYRHLLRQSGRQSELQAANEQLRQTQQNVVQQERLRALGQMASGISHDINNSLTPIIGFSDFLLECPTTGSDEAKRHLLSIRAAASDIARMVDQIRRFYRRRDLDELLPALDLNIIIREVVERAQPRWIELGRKKGVEFRIELDLLPDLPCIQESECEIREGVTNLILNAIEAMPSGGTVTVATRTVDRASSPSETESGLQVVLEVRDTGIGMDENTRQRCLEPFFSTKGPSGGGLGLAMVYGMMRRHQGTIEIESEVDHGTTVRLLFTPAGRTTVFSDPEPTTLSLPPLRILCIDDDRRIGAMLQVLLRSQQHLVEFADGGENGLDVFRRALRHGEPFQVVITDLGMPNVDGRQIVQTVKLESPNTPVIMLTSWTAMADQELELPRNVDVVVSKPPSMQRLYEALAQVAKACPA